MGTSDTNLYQRPFALSKIDACCVHTGTV